MAKINLRTYNLEIETLIEREQYDQAIAHCQHILKSFSKHVDTYRQLGKTYLESKRYSESADIFQRVLSSVPDDFVSHVGMSIIREDESNLDASLWHMERAFEVEPSNKSIKGELKRLYGRRDGLEPPKMQMTRGALIRMYIKGHLFSQAISEIRMVLSEDDSRPDLLLLLTHAYYRSGQQVEAVDTCSELLNKLPYCLEANQILAKILMVNDRADEAKTFLIRTHSLDPYSAHLSTSYPTPAQVPDQAVTLYRLDWQPGQSYPEKSPSEWSESLGIDLEKDDQEEQLPDWLKQSADDKKEEKTTDKISEGPMNNHKPEEKQPKDQQPEQIEPDSAAEGQPEDLPHEQEQRAEEAEDQPEDTQDEQIQADDETEDQPQESEIPEWMQDAGWKQSSQEPSGTTPFNGEGDEQESSEDISPAEIPDWMQDLAPSDNHEEHGSDKDEEDEEIEIDEDVAEELKEETPPEQPSTTGMLPWLEKDAPGPTDTIVTWLQEKDEEPQEQEPEAEESQIPDWLKDLQPSEEEEEMVDIEDALPEFESEAEDLSDEVVPEKEEPIKEAAPTDIPESAAEPEDELAEEESPEIPAWLLEDEDLPLPELEDEDEISAVESEAERVAEDELPDWVTEDAPEEDEELISETELDFSIDDISDEAEEDDLEEVEEPDLSDVFPEETLVIDDTQPIRIMPLDEVPVPASEVQPEEDQADRESEEVVEIPEWLMDEPEQEKTEATEAETIISSGIPDWLSEEEKEPTEEELPQMEDEQPEIEEPEVVPDAEEKIEAISQIPEEELEIAPEEEIEEPLAQETEAVIDEKESEQLDEPASDEEDETEEEVTELDLADDTMAWLKELTGDEIGQEDLVITPSQESEGLPEELEQDDVETEKDKAAAEEDILPDWLELPEDEQEKETPSPDEQELEAASEVVSEKEAQPIAAEETPEWVSEFEQDQIVEADEEEVPDTLEVEADLEKVEIPSAEEEKEPQDVVDFQPEDEHNQALENARQALNQGDTAEAVDSYSSLIKSQNLLSDIISDLEEALHKQPNNAVLWQTIGDAHLRADNLQGALDAYTKAERLL